MTSEKSEAWTFIHQSYFREPISDDALVPLPSGASRRFSKSRFDILIKRQSRSRNWNRVVRVVAALLEIIRAHPGPLDGSSRGGRSVIIAESSNFFHERPDDEVTRRNIRQFLRLMEGLLNLIFVGLSGKKRGVKGATRVIPIKY